MTGCRLVAFQAACQWTRAGVTTDVQATLGRYFIAFDAPGEPRLSYNDVVEVWQYGTYVHIRYPEGEARLEMQDVRRARRYAKKMEDAPSPLEVLGAKRGDAIAVVGLPESWVYRLLRRRRLRPADGEPVALDMLVVGISDEAGLASLPALASRVRRGGTLWVVYPRGHREIRTDTIADAGKALRLKGELELHVSSRHSALKFTAEQEILVAT